MNKKLTPRQFLLSLIYKENIKEKEQLREFIISKYSESSFTDNFYYLLLANIEAIDFKNI